MLDEGIMKINIDDMIISALKEDITGEDITTNSIIKEKKRAKISLICKEDGVVAGLNVYERVFQLLDDTSTIEFFCKDGDMVASGQVMAVLYADVKAILMGERTALNYLQRMSGIATHTRKIVDQLEGSHTRLLDTRKTTPNNRFFEKYAVKTGGGNNHRYNLSDGILIKDNHIDAAGGVKKAVQMAKEYAPFVRKIEVEVENFEMLNEALEAGADIIMLDNMSIEDMKKAVNLINKRAITECSGNVTGDRIKDIISTGVDFVSCGALTHSSAVLDISMKNLEYVKE